MEPSIRPFTICWEKMTMPSISRPTVAPCRRSEHRPADHGLMRHFAAEWRKWWKSSRAAPRRQAQCRVRIAGETQYLTKYDYHAVLARRREPRLTLAHQRNTTRVFSRRA